MIFPLITPPNVPMHSGNSHQQSNALASTVNGDAQSSTSRTPIGTISEQVLTDQSKNIQSVKTNNLRNEEDASVEDKKVELTYDNGIILKVTYHH